MTEQEALWINQALDGNEAAFGHLVESYQKPVFSLCYRMLGNSHDAEDAAQESFIRAFIHLRRFNPDRPFPTWLLSIAAHYCIDRMRRRRLPTVSTDSLPPEILPDRNAPNPEQTVREWEKQAAVQRLLDDLQPTDRAAIILRYWHAYSEVEIAETLHLTVSAVKSRLYRSRRALASAYTAREQSVPLSERTPYESSAL